MKVEVLAKVKKGDDRFEIYTRKEWDADFRHVSFLLGNYDIRKRCIDYMRRLHPGWSKDTVYSFKREVLNEKS